MKAVEKNRSLFLCLLYVFLLAAGGCAGTVIETATDTAIAVAKIPFKVGSAVVDVVTDDDDEDDEDEDEDEDD